MNSETIGSLVGKLLRSAFWATVVTAALLLMSAFVNWTIPYPQNFDGFMVRLIWASLFMLACFASIFAGTEGEE